MRKRTILVPLDGSEFSRQIVPQLLRHCEPATDTLILLEVTEPTTGILPVPPRPVSMSWTKPMHESMRDIEYSAHPVLAEQLEQVERSEIEQELAGVRHALEAAGYAVQVEARFGTPASEIADAAREHQVDLIAMATHGRSGLRQLLMGSVAEQVLRRVTIPVLLVRPFEGGEA